MDLRFTEISFQEYQDWFNAHSSDLYFKSPFHHPGWMSAAARGIHFGNGFIGIHRGKEMVGVLPGFQTRRGPFRLFGSPLPGTMTSYLGITSLEPWEDEGERAELIVALHRFIQRNWNARFIRFTFRDAPPHPVNELDVNWEQQRPGSYRLDLRSGEKALWEGVKSDCRRNIRRAQREGIEIVPFNDPNRFYQILDETMRRHGTTSFHPLRFFKLVIDELIPADILWSWGAKYQGEIIAAGLFLHDDREVHFISGASLPAYGSLPTSYLLHWHAILCGAQSGLRVYNSDASHVRSIDQFKESFNPVLEKRHSLIWAPKHIQVAKKVYLSTHAKLRQVMSLIKRPSAG